MEAVGTLLTSPLPSGGQQLPTDREEVQSTEKLRGWGDHLEVISSPRQGQARKSSYSEVKEQQSLET